MFQGLNFRYNHFDKWSQDCTNEYPKMWSSSLLGLTLYIGCIRINYKVEFLRTRNRSVIINGMNYPFQAEIQSSTKENTRFKRVRVLRVQS